MSIDATDLPFRELIDAAPDGVIVCDEQSRVVLVNAEAERMFGYAKDELVGQPIDVLVPDRARAQHGHHVAGYMGAPELRPMGVRMELTGRRKDGSEIPVEISLSPIRTARGLLVTAGIRDVSERRKVEGRLQHLYEISKLFASFETVEQAFYPAVDIVMRTLPLRSAILMETEADRSKMNVWPSEGQDSEPMRGAKEHVEAAYAYLVGGKPAGKASVSRQANTDGNMFIVIPLAVTHRPPFGALQLEGARPFDKTDLIFVNAIANQLAIALDRDRGWRRDIMRREYAEEGRTDAEARGATADRGRVIAEISSDKYEALAGENARLYDEAQQAVRVREQILAIVSHDLRNPLGTIVMTADILAKRGDLPQVARIQRAAKRMLRLIEDLLDFASIEAGRLAVKRQPQDPGAIIQETLSSFEGAAQEKGLQLTADVEPSLPKVYCDRDRILQVLSNLVGNATKATPEGGHITLRVEGRDHELLFAVSDDGPGISEEDVKHLFERYWRSSEAEYEGTGLGLAIARGIVSAHGGVIWAESELGRGATFQFTVPAADMTALFAAPESDVAFSGPPAKGAR